MISKLGVGGATSDPSIEGMKKLTKVKLIGDKKSMKKPDPLPIAETQNDRIHQNYGELMMDSARASGT